MSKYLVTGGGGFIGSNISMKLVSLGEQVRVLDNFSTGRRENLASIERSVELVEGDIRSYHTVEEVMRGVEYVLHQAALPSVSRSIADPVTTNEVNVTGTLHILTAAKSAGVKGVVIASSSSIYGNTPTLPKTEGMPPAPLSPYAVSKFTTEQYARVFHQLYDLPVVMLRYFNVFGPNQNPDSQYSAVIPKFCKALLSGESPTIYGDGEQSRDFTFVENVVNANLAAVRTPGAFGRAMNIAAGGSYSVNELFRRLQKAVGASVEPTYVPQRQGEVRDSFADISLAKELIAFKVVCDFQTGLERTLDHFRPQFS